MIGQGWVHFVVPESRILVLGGKARDSMLRNAARAMTVRRRILLAALAVGVVGILVVLIWSAGPREPEPKLSFAVCGYTNDGAKYAILTISNNEFCSLNVAELSVLWDGGQAARVFVKPGQVLVGATFPMRLGRRG